MARQNLLQTKSDSAGNSFFPSFQNEMNRLFDQFRPNIPGLDDDNRTAFFGAAFPALDVVETDSAIEISAEVPGVKETDIDASISGETLVLKGEKSADREEKEEDYHLVERHYGSFRRTIPLGFTPEKDAVTTDFADGILKLKIAKPPNAKKDVHKIEIKKS